MRDPLNEMKKSLYDRCELFIDNKDAFKAAFPWESAYFYPICASFFMDAGKIADIDYLKDCRALLKSRVNAFSNFRSHAELSIVAMLAVCDDPEKRLGEAIEVYAALKEHFWGSEYLPVAVMRPVSGFFTQCSPSRPYINISANWVSVFSSSSHFKQASAFSDILLIAQPLPIAVVDTT